MLIPLVSVLVATTLLPVLLATIGPRIDWPRRTRPPVSAFWGASGWLTVRRRWLAAGLASLILAALVIPIFSISISNPKADSLAGSGDAYQVLELVAPRDGGAAAARAALTAAQQSRR